MKKIKELAWWFGWFKRTKRLLAIVIICSSLVLFILAAYGVRQALDSEHSIWSLVSVCIMLMTFILFSFFFFVGSSMKYTSDSRNWRLAIDKGWTFANKNHGAFYEIEKRIEMLKHTKDPTELNEFMENWKSREQKRAELLRKLRYQLQKLKEIEDIMSGKKAEQIKKEIEKTKEEVRKT